MNRVLDRLAESVTAAASLEALARPLLELLETVTGLESTYLTMVDEIAGEQRVLFARNTRRLQIPEGLSVSWADSLCRRALEENRFYVRDVARCWGDSQAAARLGIVTYLSTPVRSEGTGLFGTLCAASTETVEVSEAAQRILALFARLIAQQVEREALLQQLAEANARLAEHALGDALTGLPNRRALGLELERLLAQCRRDGSRLLVAFIDLDGFKRINDRHGHAVGDRLLAAIAGRVRDGLRGGDFIARYGGDEFVVLAPVAADAGPETATQLQERLAALTRGHFQLGALALDYPGASVGVSEAQRAHTAEQVLAEADRAMYTAKQARKQTAAA